MKPKTGTDPRSSGFTLVELLIVIAIIGVLAGIAVAFMSASRQSAYNISAEHDLKEFVIAQEAYFNENLKYVGSPGESTRNDGNPSDFTVGDLRLTKGVIVTVTGGDPLHPYEDSDPYTAESRHEDGTKTYEYSVKTNLIVEK